MSLRCAAGLQKEIDSLADGFVRDGWRVTQILAEGYRAFRPEAVNVEFVRVQSSYTGMGKDLLREFWRGELTNRLTTLQPDLILFYNQSPLNLQIMRLRAKACSRSKFGLVLHDPWKSQKLNHGLRYAITYFTVEVMQRWTAQLCDLIVTLSPCGTRLFKDHYVGFIGNHVEARILLPDRVVVPTERSVVSIIGRINPSTGHDDFLALVTSLRGRLPGVSYEIVTSSAAAMKTEFAARAATAGAKIHYHAVLTEEAIETAISKSICVFRLDEELTQSGVLPLCYRAGIPVVARAIPGLEQHVEEGRTGYLLRPGTTADDLARWLDDMRTNHSKFTTECRSAFLNNWSDQNFERYYAPILHGL